MEKFINNTSKIIFRRQKDILSSALILSIMIVISRIFGFLRYRTLAGYFPKEELDLFFAAFRLPDFVFEVIITGALSSAFIPLYIKYKPDQKTLTANISSIINLLLFSLLVLVVVMFSGARFIVPILTPGFDQQKIALVISISQILLISQLPFLVLGNILSGISQASRIFIITALAPVLYNLGIIVGTVLFTKTFWIYGPVIGVIIGSFLFFLIQLPILLVVKFRYRPFSFKKPVLFEFIILFIPRVLSVITTQIDLTIDLTLSTLLGPGKYTILFFSQHLQLFPVSFLGMSFGQASLPYLSELYNEKKIAELRKLFVDSLLQLIFLSVPISLFFIFVRTPIVRFFFGGEKFDWEGTVQTAQTLSYFSLSLPFHTVFYLLTRSFYAIHDTKTPFIINFFSVLVNTGMSIYFVMILHLPVWAIALAFSVSIVINVILLLCFYYRKIDGFNIKKLFFNTVKIYVASLISASTSYLFMKLLDQLVLDTTRTINIFFLLSAVFISFVLQYLFLSWLFNIEEIYILGKLLRKIKELKKSLLEVYADIG